MKWKLFESVANFFETWRGKPIELCFSVIRWAQAQIWEHTQWGLIMIDKYEETKANLDAYGKSIFLNTLNT